MTQRPEKVAAGALFLVALWIAVYWLWEPKRPEISFGNEPQAGEVTGVGHVGGQPHDPPPPSLDQIRVPPAPGHESAPPVSSREPSSGLGQPLPNGQVPGRPVPSQPSQGQAVIPPEFEQYEVQKGDTFAAISTRFFGTPVHAQAIVRANPLMDPRRLQPGRTILVPKDPANIQGKPVAPPVKGEEGQASIYVVKSGDTLSGISQTVYGTMKYADQIFQANRDRLSSPDALRVGQTLNIPPKPREQ